MQGFDAQNQEMAFKRVSGMVVFEKNSILRKKSITYFRDFLSQLSVGKQKVAKNLLSF